MNNLYKNENWDIVAMFVQNDRIKHYSFDFWNTIAFSNPIFKQKRSEYILDYFNCKLNINTINEAFIKIGSKYNLQQEPGKNLSAPVDLLKKVIKEVLPSHGNLDVQKLMMEINALFLKFPPSIDFEFVGILNLIGTSGKTCSITSNTAFISGNTIKDYLESVGLLKKIDFCLFSDEILSAKPNIAIFEHVFLNAKKINEVINYSEIIHIGDNEDNDYRGALEFGFKSYHFKLDNCLINNRNSLHSIIDKNSIPFNPEEYSKFKFGDSTIAAKYGIELFEFFRNKFLNNQTAIYKKFLIYSSPYAHIPTSSFYLTQAFFESFRNFIFENELVDISLEFCKIRRCQTYTDDYGAMSAEQRYNLIKNDTYQLTNQPTKDHLCIFIDDISITGTHQKVIENLLKDNFIQTNSMFLYYAKLCNPEVSPSFENVLNYSYVSNLNRLREIVLSDAYKITTRTTKYILSLPAYDLETLIGELLFQNKNIIINELVFMSLANEYDKIERYSNNLKILKRSIEK